MFYAYNFILIISNVSLANFTLSGLLFSLQYHPGGINWLPFKSSIHYNCLHIYKQYAYNLFAF